MVVVVVGCACLCVYMCMCVWLYSFFSSCVNCKGCLFVVFCLVGWLVFYPHTDNMKYVSGVSIDLPAYKT